MSFSNSTNFTLKRDELIEQSYSIIGVGVEGEPLDQSDIDDAAIKLNLMLKAWISYGIKLWKRQLKNITLISGQSVYTFGQKAAGASTATTALKLVDTAAVFVSDEIAVGDTVKNITAGTSTTVSAIDSEITLSLVTDIFSAGQSYEITTADVSVARPLDVIECQRKDASGNTVEINRISRNEYENLPNKTSIGVPVNYHYDPTLNNGTLYVWLTPGASEAAAYTLDIVLHIPTNDMDNSTDDFDFPQEWLEPIMLGLAYRMAPAHGLPQSERKQLKTDLDDALELALGNDIESGSIYFQPERH